MEKPVLITITDDDEPSQPSRMTKLLDGLKVKVDRSRSRSRSRSPSPKRSSSSPLKIFKSPGPQSNYDPESIDWQEKANNLALSPLSPTHPTVRTTPTPPTAGVASSNTSRETETLFQNAIDAYEAGDLHHSTYQFKQLADGPGMPLAQLLYGLSLRHGWGCDKDEVAGFKYLRLAASTSAVFSASENNNDGIFGKEELVLAIYELGNSFRNGWGCEKDLTTALTYYETAARLQDVDAMIETATCYLNGIGTKKNKKLAAYYYREAEKKGRKEVGNSWIW
jgi:TPR repeat protein